MATLAALLGGCSFATLPPVSSCRALLPGLDAAAAVGLLALPVYAASQDDPCGSDESCSRAEVVALAAVPTLVMATIAIWGWQRVRECQLAKGSQ